MARGLWTDARDVWGPASRCTSCSRCGGPSTSAGTAAPLRRILDLTLRRRAASTRRCRARWRTCAATALEKDLRRRYLNMRRADRAAASREAAPPGARAASGASAAFGAGARRSRPPPRWPKLVAVGLPLGLIVANAAIRRPGPARQAGSADEASRQAAANAGGGGHHGPLPPARGRSTRRRGAGRRAGHARDADPGAEPRSRPTPVRALLLETTGRVYENPGATRRRCRCSTALALRESLQGASHPDTVRPLDELARAPRGGRMRRPRDDLCLRALAALAPGERRRRAAREARARTTLARAPPRQTIPTRPRTELASGAEAGRRPSPGTRRRRAGVNPRGRRARGVARAGWRRRWSTATRPWRRCWRPGCPTGRRWRACWSWRRSCATRPATRTARGPRAPRSRACDRPASRPPPRRSPPRSRWRRPTAPPTTRPSRPASPRCRADGSPRASRTFGLPRAPPGQRRLLYNLAPRRSRATCPRRRIAAARRGERLRQDPPRRRDAPRRGPEHLRQDPPIRRAPRTPSAWRLRAEPAPCRPTRCRPRRRAAGRAGRGRLERGGLLFGPWPRGGRAGRVRPCRPARPPAPRPSGAGMDGRRRELGAAAPGGGCRDEALRTWCATHAVDRRRVLVAGEGTGALLAFDPAPARARPSWRAVANRAGRRRGITVARGRARRRVDRPDRPCRGRRPRTPPIAQALGRRPGAGLAGG